MSSLNHTSRLNCFGAAAFFAAIAVMATAALGGTVNHGNFAAGTVSFNNVSESGTDIPDGGPGLFSPPPPTTFTSGLVNELAFAPNRYILTDESQVFDLKSLSSQLGMLVKAVDDPTANITDLNFSITGSYDLVAPFANPPAPFTSLAQVQMNNVPLSIKVTGVNGSPFASGTPLAAVMPVVPDSVTVAGPGGAASGTWQGASAIDMVALRAAAGLLPGDRITEIQVQASTAVHAASSYGRAQASVFNFEVQAIAVPEPPTVILAGLGAAAAAGHGLRRRMMRRSGGSVDGTCGAIALTA